MSRETTEARAARGIRRTSGTRTARTARGARGPPGQAAGRACKHNALYLVHLATQNDLARNRELDKLPTPGQQELF